MPNHIVRKKRGRKRYYPTSPLRRRIKRNAKRLGMPKKVIRKSCTAGWW